MDILALIISLISMVVAVSAIINSNQHLNKSSLLEFEAFTKSKNPSHKSFERTDNYGEKTSEFTSIQDALTAMGMFWEVNGLDVIWSHKDCKDMLVERGNKLIIKRMPKGITYDKSELSNIDEVMTFMNYLRYSKS